MKYCISPPFPPFLLHFLPPPPHSCGWVSAKGVYCCCCSCLSASYPSNISSSSTANAAAPPPAAPPPPPPPPKPPQPAAAVAGRGAARWASNWALAVSARSLYLLLRSTISADTLACSFSIFWCIWCSTFFHLAWSQEKGMSLLRPH
jgi:hypothetical protein